MVVRYAPWWLSAEYGGRNRSIVPRDAYAAFPPAIRTLFQHRAEGATDRRVTVLD